MIYNAFICKNNADFACFLCGNMYNGHIIRKKVKGNTMSKVKNYYWDEAEKYVDSLINQIKNKTMTIADAIAEAKTKTDVRWALLGFDELSFEDDLETVLIEETQ